MKRATLMLAALALLFGGVGQVKASLLTPAYQSQLESWLGEGPLTLTNIYTKQAGDIADDFHNAVDGKGRTFSLIEVLAQNGYDHQIIGGYDPQSWDSTAGFHYMPLDSQRTAFLLNLTTTTIQRQKLGTASDGAIMGQYQTYNYAYYGLFFGGGDLFVSHALTNGYGYQYSYGPAGQDGPNIAGREFDNGGANMVYGAIETYTIRNGVASSPEPASITLFALSGAALLGYAGLRRRKKAVIA